MKYTRFRHPITSRTYYRKNRTTHTPIIVLVLTILVGLYFDSQKPVQLVSPSLEIHKVSAQEVTPTPIKEEPKTEKEAIIAYIHEVFGSDAKEALIVSKCESGHRADAVGDTALMVNYQGEIVGDSIGVFQIRTGGKDFNRAKANGMTADEFRAYLKDYKNNVNYAKQIFDRQGWYPWTCKKDL